MKGKGSLKSGQKRTNERERERGMEGGVVVVGGGGGEGLSSFSQGSAV